MIDIGHGAIADSGGATDSTIVFYAAFSVVAGATVSLLSFVGVSVPLSWRIQSIIQLGFGWLRWVKFSIAASAVSVWRSVSDANSILTVLVEPVSLLKSIAQQFIPASINAEPSTQISSAQVICTTTTIIAPMSMSFNAVGEPHASQLSIQSGAEMSIKALRKEVPAIEWSASEVNVFTKRVLP